jgi:hypothetical protein
MKRLRVGILVLVAGCASGSVSSEEAMRAAVRKGEEVIREIVKDPLRADRALVAQRRLRATVRGAYGEFYAARRELAALNEEYDAPRSDMERIADRLSEKRRARYEEIIAASLSLRRAMTPEEWQEYAEAHAEQLVGR